MARKAPLIEPEWPAEHRCERCKARVYIVGSQDGDDVTIDVDAMEIRPPENGQPPVRRIAMHPRVRHVGGYMLHDPEAFLGWPETDEDGNPTGREQEVEWQWFGTWMELPAAFQVSEPLYSEHVYTCRAVMPSERLPKITNVRVFGDASGNPKAKALGAKFAKARRIRLDDERERELARLEAERVAIQRAHDTKQASSRVRLLGEFQATSARRRATDQELAEDDSCSLEQLPLF